MAVLYDNVGFTPTAGGTTDWTYSARVAGYNNPADGGVGNGKVVRYHAFSSDRSQWEIGTGAYNTGTGVLARTTVLFNSSQTGTAAGQSGAGTKINFTVAPTVVIVGLAEDLIGIDYANAFTAAQRAQARANAGAALNELGNVSFAVSASAGALTIALKDKDGNDATSATPIALTFRNATQSSGPLTVLEITAAASVVVPSTSTCGFSNAVAGRLWICGWNDGGTFRLGVFNASSTTRIYPLDETQLASSLQVVAAGNAAGQHYTAGAAVTSKAFRILGYVDWNSSGVATAGTWTTTNLNSIQTFGPGVKKPGDLVQLVYFTTSTNSTTTSANPGAATSLSTTITPTSAANLIRATASGAEANTSGFAAAGQWGRNANTNLFGGTFDVYCGTATIASSVACSGIDKPNSAASTTYTLYHWASSAGQTANWLPTGASLAGAMTLEELMG
jgi:hypothetical protein